MQSQVKICGLTRAHDIETALEFGANYLGFIIEAESPRRLSVASAAKLTAPVTGLCPCVAVTVNPTMDLVFRIADLPAFEFIQLHGSNISPDFIRQIKTKTRLSVIRALTIKDSSDVLAVTKCVGLVDTILLDAPAPTGVTQAGGHGLTFDWHQLDWGHIKTLNQTTPIGLAGGLNPDNIALAKSVTGLNFFDVSSGVEQSAGVKESGKIARFIKAAHRTES